VSREHRPEGDEIDSEDSLTPVQIFLCAAETTDLSLVPESFTIGNKRKDGKSFFRIFLPWARM
jgi:hypothetical protein